jgi:hypothetical protein
MSINFIVGTGRSGTTMLAQILNSHSRVCIPHELQLIFGYSGNGPRLYEYFAMKEISSWRAAEFITTVKNLCPHKFEDFFNYHQFFNARKYPENDLSVLLTDLYSAVAKSHGKDFFFEQTPWYGQRLDIMSELFPEAKFIHMIRDGRDVALSFTRTPWWHDSPSENLKRWQFEVTKIADVANKILKKDQYMEVRYEDFIRNPELYSSKILNFLNLSFESTMLSSKNQIDYSSYRRNDMTKHMSNEFNKWSQQRDQVVFSDNVFGWKRSCIDEFKNITDDTRLTLKRFGYEA